jgi:hypothetical protein
VWLRVKVEVRSAWKRVRPGVEAKASWAYKAALRLFARALGKNNTPQLRAALCAASTLIIIYTSLSSSLWILRSTPVEASGTMPLPPGAPTLQRPFLFLHVPGSGGVSMRTALLNDTSTLQVTKFMPCYGGLKCAINTEIEFNKTFIGTVASAAQLTILQRELRCASVVAGHFKLAIVQVLAALDKVHARAACPPRQWQGGAQYTAVVVLRHPLQRIVAHFYRFGQTGALKKGQAFSNLSATEVQVFLKQSGENLVLSYLTSSKINEFPSHGDAVRNALDNLQLCTVGIFEFWEETALLLR